MIESSTDNKEASPAPPVAWQALAWMAAGAVLYFSKLALAPVLFALLLAVLLSPLVDWLQRHAVPRMLGAILVVGILIAGMGVIIDTAWAPALQWIDDAPSVLQKVERKIRPLQRVLMRIDSVTTRATSLGSTHTLPDVLIASAVGDDSVMRMATLRLMIVDIVMVALLTVFLLIGGAQTLRSIELALVERGSRYHYLQLVGKVRGELSRYFATLALINIGLGCVTGLVMAVWGLPSPWLWGVMAGVLNFLPYVGPTISLLVMISVSLVTFEGVMPAIGVAGSFLLLTTIEGQLIQPLLVGYRLNLNPVVLFLGIWLGGWFWGIAGVALITPVLITLKEIANQQHPGPSVLKALLLDRRVLRPLEISLDETARLD